MSYNSKYSDRLDEITEKIQNRDKFKYDINEDALYEQLKNQYIDQGRLAMRDTVAQASAATGGYGNSYAETSGQQIFQGYLKGLNDKVPELYDMALQKYIAEGDELYRQYSMLSERDSAEYGKHRDDVADSQWQQSFDYSAEQDALDREYQAERDAVADTQYAEQFEYQKTQDELDREYQNAVFEYGKERDAVEDARYDEEIQYRTDRDAVEDARYEEEIQYRTDRDTVEDTQYAEQFEYQKTQDELDREYQNAVFEYGKEQDALDRASLAEDAGTAYYTPTASEEKAVKEYLYPTDGISEPDPKAAAKELSYLISKGASEETIYNLLSFADEETLEAVLELLPELDPDEEEKTENTEADSSGKASVEPASNKGKNYASQR